MIPILKDWDFDALITHNRFTLVNRNAEEMIDAAHAKGVAILNAAPYCGGVLAKGTESFARYVYQEASEEMLAPVKQVEAVCAKHNVPPGAVGCVASCSPNAVRTVPWSFWSRTRAREVRTSMSMVNVVW